jgi:hypothetical protein
MSSRLSSPFGFNAQRLPKAALDLAHNRARIRYAKRWLNGGGVGLCREREAGWRRLRRAFEYSSGQLRRGMRLERRRSRAVGSLRQYQRLPEMILVAGWATSSSAGCDDRQAAEVIVRHTRRSRYGKNGRLAGLWGGGCHREACLAGLRQANTNKRRECLWLRCGLHARQCPRWLGNRPRVRGATLISNASGQSALAGLCRQPPPWTGRIGDIYRRSGRPAHANDGD